MSGQRAGEFVGFDSCNYNVYCMSELIAKQGNKKGETEGEGRRGEGKEGEMTLIGYPHPSSHSQRICSIHPLARSGPHILFIIKLYH